MAIYKQWQIEDENEQKKSAQILCARSPSININFAQKLPIFMMI